MCNKMVEKTNTLDKEITDILFHIFRASVGYPTIMEKQKNTRKSTDLAEYIFLGTKNFEISSVVKKLQLIEVG